MEIVISGPKFFAGFLDFDGVCLERERDRRGERELVGNNWSYRRRESRKVFLRQINSGHLSLSIGIF